jgi:hypothetical protein
MGRVPLGSWLQQVEAPLQQVTVEPEVFAELSPAYLAEVWQFVVEYGRFASEAALLAALGESGRFDRPIPPGWSASAFALPTLRFIPGAPRGQGRQLHNHLAGVS